MSPLSLLFRSASLAVVPLLLTGACATHGASRSGTSAGVSAGRATCTTPSAPLRIAGALSAVAAAPAGRAWAVGHYDRKYGGVLVARWDGRAWQRVPAPSRSFGGASANLFGVTAPSADSAWAAGYDRGYHLLILRWNGATWRYVPSPAPKTGLLADVDASSPANAWAVGYTGFTQRPLILHWNGRTWVRQHVPNLHMQGALAGVAAVSRRDAWAVGTVSHKFGQYRPVILHWNGESWQRVASPNQGESSVLNSVTATSTRNAWAVGTASVGTSHRHLLIVRWNGTTWRQVPPPPLPGWGELNAVTASSPTDAWAAGDAGRNHGPITQDHALILHWNGRKWIKLPGSPGDVLGMGANHARGAWAVGVTALKQHSSKTSELFCTRRR